MGIEGRDWYPETSRARRSRGGLGLATGLLLGLALILASPQVSGRLGYTPPFGVAELFPDGERGTTSDLRLLPGVPGVDLARESLYVPDDPWQAWLADEATCPRGEDASAAPFVQVQVMLCLVNHARGRERLRPLALDPVLNASAAAKARDVVRCREFSHEACGRASNATLNAAGYHGAWGENLYAAEGPPVAPRPALDGWLNSRGHRENLFRTEWRTIGIALLGDARLGRIEDGVVWVNHFGE